MAITIPDNFGWGGAGLAPGGAAGTPTLVEILFAIVDELAAARTASTSIASPIAAADASDLATAIALVNEIKNKLNAARTAQASAPAIALIKG